MSTENSSQTYSFLALRNTVGWIGILLPFVLMLGVTLFFKNQAIPGTISLYYYTGMRDVLVGSLCAIGLFMFFYRGYNELDNWAGNLAGFFSIGIALFPTAETGPNNFTAIIHFVCAAMFFITLAAFSIFLFTRKKANPTDRKLTRNKIYIACGSVMLACMAAIIIWFIIFGTNDLQTHFVFWAETIALVAFGISWLTKGGTLFPDKKV